MEKFLAAILVSLYFIMMGSPLSAMAASCTSPQVNSGWSQFFQNKNQFPLGSTEYNQGSSVIYGFVYGLDNNILFAILYSNQYNTYVNVPISVAQQFVYTKTPDTFYLQNVKYIYHQTLEAEDCQTLQTENGTFIVVH